MSSNSKNFFSPVPNYTAVGEEFAKTYRKPTEEDIRNFLDFWQEVYDVWKQKYSPFEIRYVEEKVKVRKQLIEIFGFIA